MASWAISKIMSKIVDDFSDYNISMLLWNKDVENDCKSEISKVSEFAKLTSIF